MQEQKIKEVIENIAREFAIEIVQVKILDSNKQKTLRILIEKENYEPVNIDMCKNFSRHISDILDIEDLMKGRYILEVSSPGIERPIIKIADYKKFIGKMVKVKCFEKINDISKFKALIESVDEMQISFKLDSEQMVVDFNNIKSCKLIVTEDMIKESLRRAKKQKA